MKIIFTRDFILFLVFEAEKLIINERESMKERDYEYGT